MALEQLYSSSVLLGIYRTLRAQPNFISRFLAAENVYFETEEVEFDFEDTAYGLAPFVRSNAPGIPTRGMGSQTKKFRPAYIKMKDGITCADNAPMWYTGERPPWRTLTYAQKFALDRNAKIARHSAMKEIREEWMLANLLRTGSVNVTFQGYAGQPEDSYDVDYARNPALDVTPATLWDQATANPVSDIRKWQKTLSREYRGRVTHVIMGEDVPEHLVLHEDFNDLQHAGRRLLSGSFDTSMLRYQEEDTVDEIGNYRGVTYLSYNGQYYDQNGQSQFFVKPNEVLLVAAKQGMPKAMMLRGKIRNVNTLDRQVDMYQRAWEVMDPSGIVLSSEAAPLAATPDANFCLRATVLP